MMKSLFCKGFSKGAVCCVGSGLTWYTCVKSGICLAHLCTWVSLMWAKASSNASRQSHCNCTLIKVSSNHCTLNAPGWPICQPIHQFLFQNWQYPVYNNNNNNKIVIQYQEKMIGKPWSVGCKGGQLIICGWVTMMSKIFINCSYFSSFSSHLSGC